MEQAGVLSYAPLLTKQLARGNPWTPSGLSAVLKTRKKSDTTKWADIENRSNMCSLIQARVTEEDRLAFEAKAKDQGIPMSILIRSAVLGLNLPPPPIPKIHADTYLELARVGNNLNQIAHQLNSIQDFYPSQDEILKTIKNLSSVLKEVRLQLVELN